MTDQQLKKIKSHNKVVNCFNDIRHNIEIIGNRFTCFTCGYYVDSYKK